MTFKIAVGPGQLALHQGNSVLITEQDGQINWPTDKGFYFRDTRLISSWLIYANGEPWDLLNAANISHYAARSFLINRTIPSETGDIPAGSIGLTLSRWMAGGIHEDLDLVNYGAQPIRFNLEIAIRCDFADIFEVKAKHIVRRGRIVTTWHGDASLLRTSYANKDFIRTISVRAQKNSSPPLYANGRITFDVELPPKGTWHSCLLYEPGESDAYLTAPSACIENSEGSEVDRRLAEWRKAVLKIRTSNHDVSRLFQQAVDDMAALRFPTGEVSHLQFVPAAGVPWFVALFGRDSLIASLQNMLVYPDFARATLDALGALQARERDDYRDAQPGKIMHELRLGELAHFNLVPHTPYYGTADATMLYLIILHLAWRCIGDATLIDQHLATAERCLEWIDEYGDRDKDGFQEYETRSSVGYENQGWKDARGAVVHPDGSLVKGPKALCELQGYTYDAWIRMADLYAAIGMAERAEALRRKARAMFQRFNEAFWDEASGLYAYALDGDKRKVLTVASNIGHCLWSGLVPKDRARRVIQRLMQPDMYSGWGIRTLSAHNPSYNPHSYQNGSVWPHDNAIIAMGFRLCGHTREAMQVASGVSDAGAHFMLHQMPELYGGIQREDTNFPVQYLGVNVPQAWAAGSNFAFLQMMLGFQPDAPNKKLYLDPALPTWLPDLGLANLRVGEQIFDLHVWRDRDETKWEVLAGNPENVVLRPYRHPGFEMPDDAH